MIGGQFNQEVLQVVVIGQVCSVVVCFGVILNVLEVLVVVVFGGSGILVEVGVIFDMLLFVFVNVDVSVMLFYQVVGGLLVVFNWCLNLISGIIGVEVGLVVIDIGGCQVVCDGQVWLVFDGSIVVVIDGMLQMCDLVSYGICQFGLSMVVLNFGSVEVIVQVVVVGVLFSGMIMNQFVLQ